MQDVVIVAATRTAIGRFQGGLADLPATKLGEIVVRRLLADTGVDPATVFFLVGDGDGAPSAGASPIAGVINW